MQRRQLLLGCAPVLLAGCGGSFAAIDRTRDFITSFAQLNTRPDILDPEIRILTSSDAVPQNEPYSAAILEAGGPAANLAFCAALYSTFPNRAGSSISYVPGDRTLIGFREILWFDKRSALELDKFEPKASLTRVEADELVEHFDFDRARAAVPQFDLMGSAGPWLFCEDIANEKAVLLDFSGYSEASFREALIGWKRNVLANRVFWNEKKSKDWALTHLVLPFVDEKREGLLQVIVDGQRYRYPSGVRRGPN